MDPIHATMIRQHSTISSQVRAMTEQSWPQSQKSMSSIYQVYICFNILIYYDRRKKDIQVLISIQNCDITKKVIRFTSQ